MAVLKSEQWISVACANDRRYVRAKAVKGTFEATIQGSDGQPETVTMEPGASLKIMQKPSEVPDTVNKMLRDFFG